jgi:hypothetical protein
MVDISQLTLFSNAAGVQGLLTKYTDIGFIFQITSLLKAMEIHLPILRT